MNINNNPLNVKQGSDPWKGSTGADNRGHAIFADPADGIRAGCRILQQKWNNGKRTLLAIILEWAPVNDTQGGLPGYPANDPADYAAYVALRAGIGMNDPLPYLADDAALYARIMRAMANFETGEKCPWSFIIRGMAMWFDDFWKP